MAKTDWPHHCATFSSQQDISASARRAYCEANGLNPNSFRRELANYKPEEKPAKQASKPISKPAKDTDKRDSQKPEKKSGKGTAKSAASGVKSGGMTTRIPKTEIKINTRPNVETRPNGTRTFTKGNTAAMKHGGYASVLSEMDLEIDPDHVDLLDMSRLLKTRLLGMSKIRRDRMNGIVTMYESGHKMTRVVIGPDGEEKHEPMTLIEAMESVEYSGIESFSRLMSQFVMVEEKAISIEKMRRDTNALSKSEAVEKTAELFARRATEGLTAVETCHHFSAAGLEPPKMLLLEAEKELREMEPDPDKEVGVSQAELDEARAVAMANRANDEEEIRTRKEWLDSVLAAAGQTGEVRVTNSDDAIPPDDEDEEIEFMDDGEE